MALLNLVQQDNATDKVAEIYKTMSERMGFIPDSFKVFGNSEHVLSQQIDRKSTRLNSSH